MATWAPWTAPRLAFESGYGAGVTAPGWCAHVWRDAARSTCATLAGADRGCVARGRASGLDRVADRSGAAGAYRSRHCAAGRTRVRGIAGSGDRRLCSWRSPGPVAASVRDALLIGAEVGRVPDNVPLAPLLEDLQREQKRVRLKPEALDRELAIDLRSESGLDRSTLLHRLTLLGVPWGKVRRAAAAAAPSASAGRCAGSRNSPCGWSRI